MRARAGQKANPVSINQISFNRPRAFRTGADILELGLSLRSRALWEQQS